MTKYQYNMWCKKPIYQQFFIHHPLLGVKMTDTTPETLSVPFYLLQTLDPFMKSLFKALFN